MISGQQALERLKQGNREFAAGTRNYDMASPDRRAALADGQQPFAAVVGCSDSRVPPEIVFNQGLGDLFVIRVVGNVITPPQTGSVEYAVDQLGARLVVVLGHSSCGAVQATLQELKQPSQNLSPNLVSLIDLVKPSVAGVSASEPEPHQLVKQAVRANVEAAVNALKQGSKSLSQLMHNDGLIVTGAVYALDTGLVEFLDE